jgi:hypothetical protein
MAAKIIMFVTYKNGISRLRIMPKKHTAEVQMAKAAVVSLVERATYIFTLLYSTVLDRESTSCKKGLCTVQERPQQQASAR